MNLTDEGFYLRKEIMKTNQVIKSLLLAVIAVSLVFSNAAAAAGPIDTSVNTPSLSSKNAQDTSALTEAQLAAAANVLNLTVDELRGSLREGKTFEELSANAGVNVNLVYAAINRARATKTVPILTDKLNDSQMAAVARVLNLKPAELYASLLEGKTLEELAKAAGVANWQVNSAIRTAKATPTVPISTHSLNDAQMAAVAKVLKIQPEELYASLLEGDTLEMLAKAHGVETWQVNAAIRTAITATPTVAIMTHKLTEGQLYAVAKVLNLTGDQLRWSLLEGKTLEELAAAEGVATWKVNAAIRTAPARRGISVAETALSEDQLKAVAVILGVPVSTLKGSIREGITLAQLAKNKGIDVQILYDAVNQNAK